MYKKITLWSMIIALVVISLIASACAAPAPPATEAPPPAEEAAPAEEEAAEEVAEEAPAAEAVTVEVWFHSGKGEEREVLDAQVTDFNAMQDEIVIDAVQLPEGSYNDQVNAAALANDLPCLLDFDGPFLYNYAWSGPGHLRGQPLQPGNL
jgi:multiple sugar transport system substrate-binding protein